MSHNPGLKFRKFLFSPNSVLNFRKSYQIWGELAQEQKSYRQKTNWGWKTPPPPSAYRVNKVNAFEPVPFCADRQQQFYLYQLP